MTPGTGLYVSLDQQRPEDMLRIFASSLGSKPSLRKEGDDGGQYSPSDKQQSAWGHDSCNSLLSRSELRPESLFHTRWAGVDCVSRYERGASLPHLLQQVNFGQN